MSLAVAQGTNLFIVMQKANLEYRLMQITSQLQQLAYAVSDESTRMLNEYQRSVAISEGTDESAVAADVMSSTEFMAMYNNMTLQYQAKEKMLNTEKQQLETEQKSYDTMQEGIEKMIESGIKESFSYFSN